MLPASPPPRDSPAPQPCNRPIQGMYFHGVKFESGLDDYDELWRRNGFDDAQQVDMSGVDIDRRTNKIRIDPRYLLVCAVPPPSLVRVCGASICPWCPARGMPRRAHKRGVLVLRYILTAATTRGRQVCLMARSAALPPWNLSLELSIPRLASPWLRSL